MSYASLNARVARLEARLTAPDPEMVERVAAMLDRFGATAPEQANELLQEFGLRPCYAPFAPSEETPDA